MAKSDISCLLFYEVTGQIPGEVVLWSPRVGLIRADNSVEKVRGTIINRSF